MFTCKGNKYYEIKNNRIIFINYILNKIINIHFLNKIVFLLHKIVIFQLHMFILGVKYLNHYINYNMDIICLL